MNVESRSNTRVLQPIGKPHSASLNSNLIESTSFCVDYHWLNVNVITKMDEFPLLWVDDCLDMLLGLKYL